MKRSKKTARKKHQFAGKAGQKGVRNIDTVVDDAVRHVGIFYSQKTLITGTPTGFRKFDEKTAGLQGGDLIIIAGHPSMGKTAICSNIAEHIAIAEEKRVAFLSLEISAMQLVLRMLSSLSSIGIHKIRTGFLSQNEWSKIADTANHLKTSRINLDDSPAQTIRDICKKMRLLKMREGLDVIFIDNLQLISGHHKSINREQEIDKIVRSLKMLAKELNIPVVAISQLSLKVEERPNNRPQLGDLWEFDAIEQFADIICFVHHEERDSSEKSELRELAEIIIAKHRNGPIGCIPLAYFEEFLRFENPKFELLEYEMEGIQDLDSKAPKE